MCPVVRLSEGAEQGTRPDPERVLEEVREEANQGTDSSLGTLQLRVGEYTQEA